MREPSRSTLSYHVLPGEGVLLILTCQACCQGRTHVPEEGLGPSLRTKACTAWPEKLPMQSEAEFWSKVSGRNFAWGREF